MAANQCEGAYQSDGKGWAIQDVMPHGIEGPRTEEPTPDNLKLVGIDFWDSSGFCGPVCGFCPSRGRRPRRGTTRG